LSSAISFCFEPLEQRKLLSTVATLSSGDISGILAAAASQAHAKQIIAVVDREGQVLGIFGISHAKNAGVRDQSGRANALLGTLNSAVARARTAAFFESRQDAFTTRTARFIIQDHFPHPIPNTPGG